MNVARVIVGGLVAISTALLVGCAESGEAVVTPYTPPPHTQEEGLVEAKAAFVNYIAVEDKVAQDHFRGWNDKLQLLTTSAALDDRYYEWAEASGYYQVGDREVFNLHLKDEEFYPGYIRDPSGKGVDAAYLGACIDASQVQTSVPDSEEYPSPPQGRYSVTAVMLRVPAMDWQGNLVPGPAEWRVSQYGIDSRTRFSTYVSSCSPGDEEIWVPGES